MPRTLELTLKRPDKSMKNTKTSAKHSNPKEKRPLFGQRRRAEELPGAQPCHQRGAHPPHSVSVHQRYDRMALPRGDPQKNRNTRIMHKSKRVHFSKLPNVRAFCFQNAKFPMYPLRANIIEATNGKCDFQAQ